MREAVIVSAVRTPIGNFHGSLNAFGATQLGLSGSAIAHARARPAPIHEASPMPRRRERVGL